MPPRADFGDCDIST